MQGVDQLGDPLAESGLSSNHDRQVLLPLGDILEGCHLFQQCLNHRALRGRDGGKIEDRCIWHASELPESSGKNTQYQSDDSFCRSRRVRFQRLDATPIQTGKERLELGMVQSHHPVLDRRPDEGRIFQTLVSHPLPGRRCLHRREGPGRCRPNTKVSTDPPGVSGTQKRCPLSADLLRKSPAGQRVNGSLCSTDDTNAHKPSCPLRKSTGCVDTRTRTRLDGKIMRLIQSPAQSRPPERH
jgi:hypothetical protein